MDHTSSLTTNLAHGKPLTPLIGRAKKHIAVVTLLLRPDVRFLIPTGTGGAGSGMVLPALTRILAIRPEADSTPVSQLTRALRDMHLLLVLDNMEHVVDAAPRLIAMLETCPEVTVLVTSRVRLRVTGEREYPVPPL